MPLTNSPNFTAMLVFTLLVMAVNLCQPDTSRADFNVNRNGVIWEYTFEGDFADLTASTPAWTIFDKNGFATESTDGNIYSYTSGSIAVTNSYTAPGWSGTGPARTAEIRIRVPDATLEANDGSASFLTGNTNAHDLRIFHDRLAYNGTGGVGDPGNIVSLDMSDFRILRAVIDTSATNIYSLYIDNDPTPVIQRNDFWFANFDNFVFGDISAGGLSGKVEVDYISWTAGAFPPVTSLEAHSWITDSGGDWNNVANWNTVQVPNGINQTATLGSVITSPRTVFSNSTITLKSLQFDSATPYAVAGTGKLQLESASGIASIEVTGGAGAGAHQLQLSVELVTNAEFNVGSGASLALNNALHLGDKSLVKSGEGTLLINNQLGSGSGEVVVSEGVLGGTGRVFANVQILSGGEVAPGKSTGKLTVQGNYSQESGSTLSIELGGLTVGENYDVLNVLGSIALGGGTLDVQLVNGFTPTSNDSFNILNFASLSGTFADIILPAGFAWDTSELYTSGLLSLASAVVTADFDSDGVVDGSDFLAWQRGFGITGGANLADGDANGDGNVDVADLEIWQATFGTMSTQTVAATAIPEPQGLSMMFALGIFFRPHRHRRGVS